MSKGKLVAPYVKEKNLLQLPLFDFGKRKKEKIVVTWKDEKGEYSLKCNCEYGVPGAMEQDVFTACMRIWVKKGMPEKMIEVTYSEIARELDLSGVSWNSYIKQSLDRLGKARYELNQCFVKADKDGNKKIDAHFSLFDSVVLFSLGEDKNARKSKSMIAFPDLIKNNLQSSYYQYLDIAWFRALPSGLPRRLYEYLAKRKYHGVKGLFRISEEALCRWLPIADKNATNRRNRLKKTAQALIEKGYLSSYEFDKKKKQCIFTYAKNATPQQEVIEIAIEKPIVKMKKLSQAKEVIHTNNHSLDKLIALVKLKRIPKTMREIVTDYLDKNGPEYVKRNILYANQNAKRNYSTYLQKALANDWGKVWAEEQEVKQKAIQEEQQFDIAEAIRLDEERRAKEEHARKERERELKKQATEFTTKVNTLGSIVRDAMRQKATNETPVGCPPQVTRIKYATLLLDAVNQMGNSFSNDLLTPDFIKDLWEISTYHPC